MGKEIEIKLAVPDEATLLQILADASVGAARSAPWQRIRMETTYLDTPARELSARKWMLRRRMEDGEAVYTMKTPGNGYVRGEWASRRDALPEAVQEMIRRGAPAALAELTAGGVEPVCGVRFTRQTAELSLPGGTRCFFCADSGHFLGGARRRPFYEVELELSAGTLSGVLPFAEALKERYGLREEEKSKFLRAAELTE